MSATGTQSSGLLQTIETDLKAGENWLETTVEGTALAIWNIVKVAFLLATSEQAQVIMDVFARLQADVTAGKSLDDIETDLLNTATADEKVILEQAGSQIIQGFVAFLKASNSAAPATA